LVVAKFKLELAVLVLKLIPVLPNGDAESTFWKDTAATCITVAAVFSVTTISSPLPDPLPHPDPK
jgi:hypothetical protein